MVVLCLDYGFSAEQLKKQFHRLSLRNHPDKGGSQAIMQHISAARDLCVDHLAKKPGPIGLPEPPERHPHDVPTAPPSAPPSADLVGMVTSHAMEFLAHLEGSGPNKGERCMMRALIKQIAKSPLMDKLLQFALECVELLAHSQRQQCASGDKSWEACGFKYLSYQGYDVIGGLRIVDYGNYEYLALIEFWSLRKPAIWESLNIMRKAWPVLLDLWSPAKTERHVERLADIVEIVMGALRGEDWFGPTRERRLPDLLALHVALCRLVQQLNARLKTEYLKYKKERVKTFKVPGMFSQLWRDDAVSKGLLLCGLLQAAEQIA